MSQFRTESRFGLIERDFIGKEADDMYSLHGRETIYLQALRPGMVLAEPVVDRNGNRLLNSEIKLDEPKIARLRERGVNNVRVEREIHFSAGGQN